MENIDYNDIIQYINQEIIGQRIKYYSSVTKKTGFLYGGAAPVAAPVPDPEQEKSAAYSIKQIGKFLKAFGIEKESDLYKRIIEGCKEVQGVITGVKLIGIAMSVLSLFSRTPIGQNLNANNIVLLAGMISTLIFVTSGNNNSISKISENFGESVTNLFDIGKSLAGIAGAAKDILAIGATLDPNKAGGSQIVGAISSGVKMLGQFASFIYYLIEQMITRPLLASLLNSVKSIFTTGESDFNPNSSTLLDELRGAFATAWSKASSSDQSSEAINKQLLSSFKWDEQVGDIKYTGVGLFDTIVTDLYPDKKITMKIKYGAEYPIYLIDSVENKSKSLISGKSVPTPLVICYIESKTRSNQPNSNINQYSFTMGPNGSVSLYKNGQEISTITRAYQAHINSDPKAGDYIKQTCQSLFGIGVGDKDPVCSNYFYSAIGSSVEGILRTLGGVSHNIYGQIVSADLPILFDMLQRLGWQTRLTLTNRYELVDVDEWMGSRGKNFSQYIGANPKVKTLLEHIVKKINSNPDFINIKYKYESQETLPKKKYHPKSTINVSRLVTLGDTLSLIGLSSKNVGQRGGGITSTLESTFQGLKQSLNSFGQKLSPVTEKQIEAKIKSIIEIEKEIEQINTKILNYVKLLKTNRNASLPGKVINLEEIDSMLAQQTGLTSKYNKHIAVLTSAFGKIKVLIGLEDAPDKPKQSGLTQFYHGL